MDAGILDLQGSAPGFVRPRSRRSSREAAEGLSATVNPRTRLPVPGAAGLHRSPAPPAREPREPRIPVPPLRVGRPAGPARVRAAARSSRVHGTVDGLRPGRGGPTGPAGCGPGRRKPPGSGHRRPGTGRRSLVQAMAEFRLSSLGGLPDPLGRQGFWTSLGDHLVDDLLEEYLRIHHPHVFLVLRLWGAIRYEPTVPTEPHRRPYVRTLVDLDQAVAMVTGTPAGPQAGLPLGRPEPTVRPPGSHRRARERPERGRAPDPPRLPGDPAPRTVRAGTHAPHPG